MIIERTDQAVARQSGKEIGLPRDHPIRPRDQVVVDTEIDEPEQYGDEDREQARQRRGPVKRLRAYELQLKLPILPSACLTGPTAWAPGAVIQNQSGHGA
ncbi:hypothetical protein [Bradyrhizobium valentinum]|uniref:hypothetical protein n=1 Tax=Bradyrhizobium valentinum TaxID=1518501 RepID=UPI001FD8D08B|nr:hypothetical protein [Bradyrhizobium valentinum]